MAIVADVLEALAPHGARLLAGPAHRTALAVASLDAPEAPIAPGAGLVLIVAPGAARRGARRTALLASTAQAGAVLVVLCGPARALAAGDVALAERAGLAVATAGEARVADVALAVARVLSPAPADAFARLFAAHAAIEEAEPDGVEAVLRAGSRALGSTLRRFDVAMAGRGERIVADRAGPVEDVAAALAGAAIARIEGREAAARSASARMRSDLVLGLVTASAERLSVLSERAAALGLGLGRYRRALWFEPAEAVARDPLELATLGAAALEHAQAALDPERHVATLVDASLVVFASSASPDGLPLPELRRLARELLAAMRAGGVQRALHVGIGGAHRGATAFRSSAAEARSAAGLAATAPDGIAAFDATGVHALVIGWLAADTSRALLDEVLGPLDRLGAPRGPELVRTLDVYLDARGSLQRVAEALSLHRNAVAYRMRQIRELLADVDLDDPDQRLALQIACRARRLSERSTRAVRPPSR